MFKLVLTAIVCASAFADVSHIYRQPFRALPTYAPVVPIRTVVPQAYAYSGPQIPILRNDQVNSGDGSYSYNYETGNGIQAQETGSLKQIGNDVATVAQGGFSYTAPDGTPVSLSYVADENGFHATGSHIPTPPPVPAAIQRALDYIASRPQQSEYQYQTYQPQLQYQRRFF